MHQPPGNCTTQLATGNVQQPKFIACHFHGTCKANSEHSKELIVLFVTYSQWKGTSQRCASSCGRLHQASQSTQAQPMPRSTPTSEHSKELIWFDRHDLSVEGHITKMCIIIQGIAPHTQQPATSNNRNSFQVTAAPVSRPANTKASE